MTRLLVVAALVLIFATSTEPATGATPEPRIALVIGNSAYTDIPLANPANDARLMAETLRGLGFDVIERIDADMEAMQLAIFELQDRLVAAGRDAVGLFFYAGHGVQVGGQNYFIPLHANIVKERDVSIRAVSAGFVLGQMEVTGNRMNFIILDACRNNPLTRSFRSGDRGLARMDAPRGSIVAYSTGPGQVAADGDGRNSPYTLALSRAMQTPGVPAEKMFKVVRDSVMADTDGDQTPWEESSLTGADFYFNPAPTVATLGSAPARVATPAPSAPDTGASERLFWESIKDSDDPAMFEAYLQEFPNGKFTSLARLKRNNLEKAAKEETQTTLVPPPPEPAGVNVELIYWQSIQNSDSVAEHEAYLRKFPSGEFSPLVRTRLAKLKAAAQPKPEPKPEPKTQGVEMAFWDSIKDSDEPADYRAYLEAYPNGAFAELARVRAERPSSTQLAALPLQETEAVTRPKRSGRVINVQPIRDFRGLTKPILTDIVRYALQAVPNAVVISEQPGGDDDVVVSGSVLRFDQRQEPNPDYQTAQIGAAFFGGLAAAATANIPPSHTLIDVEVLISAQDAATGETFSESGYANVKADSRYVNATQAGFDALQTAVDQAAKRVVARLTGGTPQQQVTAAEISNDPKLRREITRFYNKKKFWKTKGSKNRITEMVKIYDISLASVSDNLIKLDVRYRWQLEDMQAGRDADGVATVERSGPSFRVLDFQ